MANVEVLDWKKKKVSDVELSDQVFACDVKKNVLHDVVKWQLASRRQGTHKTKTRAFVSGGGRKPFKQKGTGNARQGTNRSPLMPGGAILFGPQPRDYSYALPKKLKRAGLRMALSYLNKNGKLSIVDAMNSEGKTGELDSRLKAFGVQKAVLIDGSVNEKFKQAAKNLKSYKYFPVEGLNVYDLLKFDHVILTKDSIDSVTQRCLN
ncbi:MAG: 50S ribosomal protein L4 [Bdellovibrionaceae bacterium]|jgi:large subunit ribosomal protein L4|nr:50S ribosomal protein L4 [Pseudobdellovibrionaceae bacterium]